MTLPDSWALPSHWSPKRQPRAGGVTAPVTQEAPRLGTTPGPHGRGRTRWPLVRWTWSSRPSGNSAVEFTWSLTFHNTLHLQEVTELSLSPLHPQRFGMKTQLGTSLPDSEKQEETSTRIGWQCRVWQPSHSRPACLHSRRAGVSQTSFWHLSFCYYYSSTC